MQKRKYWGSQLEASISFFYLHSDRLRKESNGWEVKTNINKISKNELRLVTQIAVFLAYLLKYTGLRKLPIKGDKRGSDFRRRRVVCKCWITPLLHSRQRKPLRITFIEIRLDLKLWLRKAARCYADPGHRWGANEGSADAISHF